MLSFFEEKNKYYEKTHKNPGDKEVAVPLASGIFFCLFYMLFRAAAAARGEAADGCYSPSAAFPFWFSRLMMLRIASKNALMISKISFMDMAAPLLFVIIEL